MRARERRRRAHRSARWRRALSRAPWRRARLRREGAECEEGEKRVERGELDRKFFDAIDEDDDSPLTVSSAATLVDEEGLVTEVGLDVILMRAIRTGKCLCGFKGEAMCVLSVRFLGRRKRQKEVLGKRRAFV